MNCKIISLFLISILFFPSISSFTNAVTVESRYEEREFPESYLIEDVPYIYQEGGFFCFYASEAMIFKYLGINTSLREILYLKGLGHSIVYPSWYNTKIPIAVDGAHLGYYIEDEYYISELYGLNFSYWPTNTTDYYEGMYEEYLFYAKQNLSKNLPLMVFVDVYQLPFVKEKYNLPDFLYKSFKGSHCIVLVGYNESNNTVCVQDPAGNDYGDETCGVYEWIDVDDFKVAVLGHSDGFPNFYRYAPVSEPLPKNEIFEIAYERNIDRLKGNTSSFNATLVEALGNESFFYGINATKKLKEAYSTGMYNRILTMSLYELYGKFGIRYRIYEILRSLEFLPKAWRDRFNIYHWNGFTYTIECKMFAADFLRDNLDLSPKCEYELALLEQEAQNWSKINCYFNIFQKQGILMSRLKALYLMSHMEDIMENIVSIEESIISGPTIY